MAGQVPVDALSEDMAKLGLEKAAVEKLLAFLQVESGWVGMNQPQRDGGGGRDG